MLNKNYTQIKDLVSQEQELILKQIEELQKKLKESTQKNFETEIKQYIINQFEDNYELLSIEAGSRLTPSGKAEALKQVLLYWQKMKDVATSVTKTEVKLSLPNQRTSTGITFTIEGVVDIISDRDHTIMYDIKTHDADQIKTNIEPYQKQLNVYAHIWQTLRGQHLSKTAVIATAFPSKLKDISVNGTDEQIEKAVAEWQPLIEIPFNQENVQTTIQEFTRTVEDIENGRFQPPPVTKLKAQATGTKSIFAVHTCRNCDARFSCNAYRAYALNTHSAQLADFLRFYAEIAAEMDQSDWLTAGLNDQTGPEGIDINDLII